MVVSDVSVQTKYSFINDSPTDTLEYDRHPYLNCVNALVVVKTVSGLGHGSCSCTNYDILVFNIHALVGSLRAHGYSSGV